MRTRGSRKSLRVIVLDDDVEVAEAICDMLGLEGHVGRAVHDLPAAWHALHDGAPDVLVADYHIGVMTSGLLVVAVRCRFPAVRRVLISASPPWEWDHLVADGLVHAALQKPFLPLELIELVEAIGFSVIRTAEG
jgi:CheY-like chemotaxis protein